MKSDVLYVGIDPGSTGAIACILNDIFWIEKLSTYADHALAVKRLFDIPNVKAIHLIVEFIHAGGGAPCPSLLKAATKSGAAIGAWLAMTGEYPMMLTPKEWQRTYYIQKRNKAKAKEYGRVKPTSRDKLLVRRELLRNLLEEKKLTRVNAKGEKLNSFVPDFSIDAVLIALHHLIRPYAS